MMYRWGPSLVVAGHVVVVGGIVVRKYGLAASASEMGGEAQVGGVEAIVESTRIEVAFMTETVFEPLLTFMISWYISLGFTFA
jgi:hypothetical protein